MRQIYIENPIIDAEEKQQSELREQISPIIDADDEHNKLLARKIVDGIAEKLAEQSPIIVCN